MVKRHLKVLNTPKTWDLARKATMFTTRPNPGAHSYKLGISINYILKNELNIASITKESKQILNNKDCLVNGKIIKDVHHLVGFMDTISLPRIKKNYRMTLSQRGKISAIEINEKEIGIKLSKIMGKTKLKSNKIQINTLDGRNIIVKEDTFKTSDSILIEVPSQKIKKSFTLEDGATIMIIGGKHIGTTGKIEKIDNNAIFFKSNADDKTYETLKRFAFVLGKDKSEVTVQN